jgi:LynF/TruF/PatF family peptide O-prenyltransferase
LLNAQGNALSTLFLNLIRNSPEAHLECSCKINDYDIYPMRLNLWYENGGKSETINKIAGFLNNCSKIVDLNFSLYHGVVDRNFIYDKIGYSIVGIDARESPGVSRIKLWHIIKDYQEMEKRILGFEGISPIAKKMKVHKGLLFGFDFASSGKTAMKVYPVWHDFQIKQNHRLLLKFWGSKVVEMAKKCDRISFVFNTKNDDVTLHMIPVNTEKFIGDLGHKNLFKVYQSLNLSKVIVSLTLEEIEKGNYRTFNLYY